MTQYPRRPKGAMDRLPWVIELSALVANLLSMAALVTVLAIYDRKPIFYWHKLTLNTIVSVISTAAKAPVMFVVAESISQWKWIVFYRRSRRFLDFQNIDAASRGPVGSLKLLWTCKKDFALQLGALITIVSIAIDPFSQQLIQYELNPAKVSTADANIVRAQRYSKGVESSSRMITLMVDGHGFNGTRTNADFAMQAAVLYGLTHSLEDTVKQVQLKCPSGNCTWDAFESLAVCNTCNDVSAYLSVERAPGWLVLASIRGEDGVVSANPVTTFKLPNGLFIDNISFNEGDTTAWMTSFGTGNRNETVSLKDVDTLIWGMSFLRPHNSSVPTWEEVELEAIECGLYYCVNRYTPSVENAEITESEEPVFNASRSADSWQPATEAETLETLGWLESLNFHSAISSIQRSDLMLGENFNISQSAVDSISSFFQQTFSRFTDPQHPYADANFTGFSRSADDFEPAAIQPFISIPDLRSPFVSLARSMTNALRANSDTAPQTGTIRIIQTYYVIAWQWIALHAVVIITGTTFMLFTMQETRKLGIPVWTSSALAILSEGENARGALTGAVTRGDIEARAEALSVQFCPPDEVIKSTSTQELVLEELRSSPSGASSLGDLAQDDIQTGGIRVQTTYSVIPTDDTP